MHNRSPEQELNLADEEQPLQIIYSVSEIICYRQPGRSAMVTRKNMSLRLYVGRIQDFKFWIEATEFGACVIRSIQQIIPR